MAAAAAVPKAAPPFWDHSRVIGLAKSSCCTCHGYGLRVVHKKKQLPCHCVFRAIFRACYNRFRDCVANAGHTSSITLDFPPRKETRRFYSRKREEFIADFCLVSARELGPVEYGVFRDYFVIGWDWKTCCSRLKLDRGNFFHLVYLIEQKLGKIFAELEPYPLYPLDEYFGGKVRTERPPRWPAKQAVPPLPWSNTAPTRLRGSPFICHICRRDRTTGDGSICWRCAAYLRRADKRASNPSAIREDMSGAEIP